MPGRPARLPAAARQKSQAAARSFVLSYFAAYNEAIKNPNKAQLIGYGSGRCAACYSHGGKIEVLLQNKWHGKSDFLDLSELKVTQTGDSSVVVQGIGHELPARIADKRGRTVLVGPDSRRHYRFTLSWTHDRWFLDAIKTSATI
ncbi:hypothetical protein [Luteipulveratus mongoliensis]|nr:hypothetical protein [Luteipulveratus mongoliensis]